MERVELKGEYSDFIGTYHNVYDSKFCDGVVSAFDYYQEIDAVFCEDNQFENSNSGSFDWALDLAEMNPAMKDNHAQLLNQTLQECFDEYVNVFGHLKTVPMYSLSQKIRRLLPVVVIMSGTMRTQDWNMRIDVLDDLFE